MINLKKKVSLAVIAALGDKGSVLDAEAVYSMLEYPPDTAMGDIAFPCFKLSRSLRMAPPVIAASIKEGFSCEGISEVNVAGGYLNLRIDGDYLAKNVLGDILGNEKYGSDNRGQGKTVVLDYSSPNVAKPFHIGHLGTTVIGHSLKLIHEYFGYKCVGINYLGDWGTQFGKLIVAYRLWGNRQLIEEGGIDKLVELYVRFHKEAEEDKSLEDRARAEFKKLEMNDEENIELWRWFVNISLAEYQKTYKQLGIEFDSYKGESFYTDKMPAEVEKLRNSGLLKIDDGASIVDLEEYGMPPCLILKRDGSTLYPTRDIAAAVYRKNEYKFDKCIYVTSAGQSLHFAQWFKVVELMGYPWFDELVHVPYGTVSINGAKLATRSGNVVLLKELFAEAIDRVDKIIAEKNPELENRAETAEAVGVGAIVFNYLSGGRIKDINFMIEDALSFEGNTGPYAQYTYARCRSLMERAGEIEAKAAKVETAEERELSIALSRFPEVLASAIRDYEPSVITRYILEVCGAYNRFYHNCPILSAEDKSVVALRMSLTEATAKILGTALELICVKHPEKI